MRPLLAAALAALLALVFGSLYAIRADGSKRPPDRERDACVRAANEESFACLDYCKVTRRQFRKGCDGGCIARHEVRLDECGLR